jgi:hypothetical protein
MLAARARGLGTVWTTWHLNYEPRPPRSSPSRTARSCTPRSSRWPIRWILNSDPPAANQRRASFAGTGGSAYLFGEAVGVARGVSALQPCLVHPQPAEVVAVREESRVRVIPPVHRPHPGSTRLAGAAATPEKGLAEWKDGFSAKEQAKSWLRSGRPQMPHELWSALSVLVSDADEVYGRPEHTTRLDKFSRARQHDLFPCLRGDGVMTTAIGIEAKACEDYDGRSVIAPGRLRRARSTQDATF